MKIFVNYCREDAGAQAARIRDRLAAVFGPTNVFMDIDDLQPGQRFHQELARALSQCNVFLAIIGAHWYDQAYARAQAGGHDYVRDEIATALARGTVIVPVLIDRAALPRPEALPEDIRPLVLHQAYRITHEYFGRDVEALIAALEGEARSATTAPNVAISWVKRGLASIGYAALTLVVVSNLGILHGRQPSLVEAISALCVLSAGVAAFAFGTRRWRWLRVIGAVVGSSLLASWITPIVNQEVTIYKAMCEPIDYEFWECERKGGHLTPVGSDRFRVDHGTQTVFRFGGDRGSTYHFTKCTVADRLNWSCHYNDNSAIIEVTEGKYRSITLDEKNREFEKTLKPLTATGQVPYLQWLQLYLPFVVAAWMPGSSSSSPRQDSLERIVVIDSWWNVDYARNVITHPLRRCDSPVRH